MRSYSTRSIATYVWGSDAVRLAMLPGRYLGLRIFPAHRPRQSPQAE
jgi:hypothetical protein